MPCPPCAFERPVLLAWAPDDLLFPVRLAERLAADLPDARIVALARGRAFTPLEQPAALARGSRAPHEGVREAA